MNEEDDKLVPQTNSKVCIEDDTKSTCNIVLKRTIRHSKKNPNTIKKPDGNDMKDEVDVDGGSSSVRVSEGAKMAVIIAMAAGSALVDDEVDELSRSETVAEKPSHTKVSKNKYNNKTEYWEIFTTGEGKSS